MCKLFKWFAKPEPEPLPPRILKIPYYKVNVTFYFQKSSKAFYFIFDERPWAATACAQLNESNSINVPEQPIFFSYKENPENPIVTKDIWIETLEKEVVFQE